MVENKVSSISKSNSLEQMGEFWDTHDFTEFDDMQVADVKFDFSCAVTIEPELLSGIANFAHLRGIQVETLANLWLQQKLSEQTQAA